MSPDSPDRPRASDEEAVGPVAYVPIMLANALTVKEASGLVLGATREGVTLPEFIVIVLKRFVAEAEK
jgi:hypothetical protein